MNKVILLLCLVGAMLTPSLSVRNFPMQAHGFNEVDYFAQLLIKGLKIPNSILLTLLLGIDSFKIDINALDHETCLEYSTWKKTDNKCETNEFNANVNINIFLKNGIPKIEQCRFVALVLEEILQEHQDLTTISTPPTNLWLS